MTERPFQITGDALPAEPATNKQDKVVQKPPRGQTSSTVIFDEVSIFKKSKDEN